MDEMDVELDSDEQINADEEEALLKSDDEKLKTTNDKDEINDVDKSSSDDDEDDEDDDDDKYEEEQNRLEKEYLQTLSLINQNKYDYNNYVQLVEIARKLLDVEKMRESCELFSSMYPLSPEIWLNWLKIESSIATSPEEINKLEILFRRALNDYYCPNVALEFAKFACKSPNSDEIWEEILKCYTLHCVRGRELFVLWRQYFDKKDLPEAEKLKTISKVYQEELQIPLYDMEKSYIEFKVLYQKNKNEIDLDWNKIDEKYNKAKDQLNIMLPFEKQLTELDPKHHQERATLYKNYINAIKKICNEYVVQILWERMVTECCLNETCWIDYANYVEERDIESERTGIDEIYEIFAQTSTLIVDRALRNCTWSEKLFILKMRLFEDIGFDKSEIKEVLECALEAGFPTPEPVVNIWLEYLSCFRRLTDYNVEEDVQMLRNNIEFAWNSLGKQWGVLADCNCEILQFWGRLEYGPLKNPVKGRELWYTVMGSSDNAYKSGLWIEFVHLDMRHDLGSTRKIFRKALSYYNEMDNIFVIISAWLRFERCNGSLDNLKYCEKQCEMIMNQLNWDKVVKQNKLDEDKKPKNLKRKSKDTAQTASTSTGNETKDAGISQQNKDVKSPAKKPKLKTDKQETKNVLKEHENDEIDLTKDHLRIFLSNLDYNITEDEIKEGLSELSIVSINLIKSVNGRGRGFGYAELTSEDEVQKALKLDNRLLKGRPVYISSVLRDKEKRQKFKYSNQLEPTKLFVKGIPYDATNEELKEIFEKYGTLKDVRIVYHKSGKSKGIAYVEYETATSASLAVLKLDQYEFRGLTLNVAISAPPAKSSKEPFNIQKYFGGNRKPSIKTEQRPRMNLIPTSVRKLVAKPSASTSSSQQNMNGNAASSGKTNEDFRRELMNK